MSAGRKVALFVLGLLAVGAVGAAIGTAVGPIDTGPEEHAAGEHPADADADAGPDGASSADPHAGHDMDADAGTDAGGSSPGAAAATASVQDSYRLVLEPLAGDELRLEVLDPEGAPVVDAEVVHEQRLHLIIVSRDLVGFHHVHPVVDADGTWSVTVPDLGPGSYRAIADLTPEGGPALALAADLTVPGPLGPVAVPAPSATAPAGDVEVALDGTPRVGESDLSFTVTRGGEPVVVDPYLGARGHLVALRTSDLAYSHVHPHEGTEGPIAFAATFPSPGTYRLFLDLQVDGEVRTAAFTVEVPEPGEDATPPSEPSATSVPAASDETDDHHHEEGTDHAHG